MFYKEKNVTSQESVDIGGKNSSPLVIARIPDLNLKRSWRERGGLESIGAHFQTIVALKKRISWKTMAVTGTIVLVLGFQVLFFLKLTRKPVPPVEGIPKASEFIVQVDSEKVTDGSRTVLSSLDAPILVKDPERDVLTIAMNTPKLSTDIPESFSQETSLPTTSPVLETGAVSRDPLVSSIPKPDPSISLPSWNDLSVSLSSGQSPAPQQPMKNDSLRNEMYSISDAEVPLARMEGSADLAVTSNVTSQPIPSENHPYRAGYYSVATSGSPSAVTFQSAVPAEPRVTSSGIPIGPQYNPPTGNGETSSSNGFTPYSTTPVMDTTSVSSTYGERIAMNATVTNDRYQPGFDVPGANKSGDSMGNRFKGYRVEPGTSELLPTNYSSSTHPYSSTRNLW